MAHSLGAASSSLVSSSFSLSLFSSSLSFLNSREDGSSVSSEWAFCSSTTDQREHRRVKFNTIRIHVKIYVNIFLLLAVCFNKFDVMDLTPEQGCEDNPIRKTLVPAEQCYCR